MEPTPGKLLRVTDGYALSADFDHSVGASRATPAARGRACRCDRGRRRLHARERHGHAPSWWLTERSTPSGGRGSLVRRLQSGRARLPARRRWCSQRSHRRSRGSRSRRIETLEEYAESRRLALAAFANPHQRNRKRRRGRGRVERQADPIFAALARRPDGLGRTRDLHARRRLPDGGLDSRHGRADAAPTGPWCALDGTRRSAGDSGARGRSRIDVAADPRTARLRAGTPVLSARVRTLDL